MRWLRRSRQHAAAMVALAASLVAFATSSVCGSVGNHITPDVMARSRGSNQTQNPKGGFCNSLNAGFGCRGIANGGNCNTCGTAYFPTTANGAGAFANGTGAAGNCGLQFQGVCTGPLPGQPRKRCVTPANAQGGAPCQAQANDPGPQNPQPTGPTGQ